MNDAPLPPTPSSTVPIYLKTGGTMERPVDPEYYLLARNDLFFCRNHPFFRSDVPGASIPGWLAPHQAGLVFAFPRVPRSVLEFVAGFFGRIHELYGSEAIVLLWWSEESRRYRIAVPEQEATVWVSAAGERYPVDVRYEIPLASRRRQVLAGDIHSHGREAAYASRTDENDERYRDGFHGVVGLLDREPPQFHQEFAVDGHRFPIAFDELYAGYARRRRLIPRAWIDRVRIRAEGPGASLLDGAGRREGP